MDSSQTSTSSTPASGAGSVPTETLSQSSSLQSKRKNRSIAWDHFTLMKNPDGTPLAKPRAKCNWCPQTYGCDSRSNGTSNMRSHLLYNCPKCPLRVSKKQKQLVQVFVLGFLFPKLKIDRKLVEVLVINVKSTLQELFNEYAANDPDAALASYNSTQPMSASNGIVDEEDSHSATVNEFVKLRQEKDVVEIKTEVDKYMVEASEDPRNPNFQLLGWWKENLARFPILSQIARDVFAVPASTIASESAFSLGSRILDPFRASLTPKMVEALVCTSDWLRDTSKPMFKTVFIEPIKTEMEQYSDLEKLTSESVVTNASVSSSQTM